jgi:hypothetical protein
MSYASQESEGRLPLGQPGQGLQEPSEGAAPSKGSVRERLPSPQAVTISSANIRDASWITANLGPVDYHEAFCQLPAGTHHAVLAEWLIRSGQAFIAYKGETPVALFGTSPINVCCMNVWALGTKSLPRVIPAVSRFLVDRHIPERLEQGFTSMEARALATHGVAHRWIEGLGGVRHGPAFLYGSGGEFFVLFRWTVASYRTIREGRWSKR